MRDGDIDTLSADGAQESDSHLRRMLWSEAQIDAYADAAERLCHCEGLCVCGWDDPGSLVMQQIERMR